VALERGEPTTVTWSGFADDERAIADRTCPTVTRRHHLDPR
jgi:hypothetical protein